MYASKTLLQSFLWTAHGVKILPNNVELTWCTTADGSNTISAMPYLDQLLADPCHVGVLNYLRKSPLFQYDNSLVVRRDVWRIPLKLDFQTSVMQRKLNICKRLLMD